MLDNMKVCGSIFSTEDYNFFALRCFSCEEHFGQWPTFITHLKNEHIIGRDKDTTTVPFGDIDECTEMPTILTDATMMVVEKLDDNVEEDDITEDQNTNTLFQEVIIEAADICDRANEDYLKNEISENENSNDDDLELEENIEPRQFNFNLQDDNLKKMSLQFLKLLEVHPVLWNKQLADYRKPYLKAKILQDIKSQLNTLGYISSDGALRRIIQSILSNYEQAHICNDLDAPTQYFLDKCQFLQIVFNKQTKNIENIENNIAEGEDDVNSSDEESCNGDESTEEDLKNLNLEQEVTTAYSHSSKRSYKRIRFNVPSNKIAIEFVELLKKTPLLWKAVRSKKNSNLTQRKEILARWLPHFQKVHNIDFNYEDISLNLQHLRRYYNDLLVRKELDDGAKQFIELCSFMPQHKRAGRIKCQHCNNFFLTENNYQAHLYTAHKIGESPYRCTECDKSFASFNHRNLHIKQVHVKKFDYPCTYCDRRFLQPSNLEMHLAVHTGEKKFICETCGKSFRRRINLKYHETRIHLRQRNFACNMCPKSFYTKSLLKDHVNAHLDIRNCMCPFCGKGFHSSHALMRHKQIHSEVKRYECKLCDSRFHQFVGLNSHMKNRHKYVPTKNEATISETELETYKNEAENETVLEECVVEMLEDYEVN